MLLILKSVLLLFVAKCNQRFDCIDGSDEASCKCEEGQQKCDCYTKKPVTCETHTFHNFTGCYSTNQSKIEQCGADITLNRTVQCGNCNITISRFANISECERLNDPQLCDKSTCYHTYFKKCFQENCTLTEVICTSKCSDPSCTTGFQCNDSSLVLKSQFCDGKFDCPDRSDEIRYKPGFKCIELKGTCVLPQFCKDICHTFFTIGEYYCDGVYSPVYQNIRSFGCSRGFDELFCSKRHACCAVDKASIRLDEMCNEVVDCDDGSDERNCPKKAETVFSSDTEMIKYDGLKICFWIVGLAVIVGNMYVIISTLHYIRKKKNLSTSLKFQHLNVLNISIADFTMGFYLMAIAILSTFVYSGNYGKVDRKWRTSEYCSFLGSLAVLSSEASCFLMVLLTFYRLHNVYKPFSTLLSPSFIWKVGLVLAWFAAVALAFIPMIRVTGSYFEENIFFSNCFTTTTTGNKTFITNFACRLAAIKNIPILDLGKNWQSVKTFLDSQFPEYSAFEEGYYGATSVCMPRFFVTRFESAMEYTLIVISINFICFIFITISYITMYILSKKRLKIQARNNQAAKQDATMQRRIARIIFTDFLCWIPICIMVYAKIIGATIDDIIYVVSAAILLPINSAFNPLLYSSLVDKLIACCCKKHQKRVQNIPMKKVK